MAQEDLESMLNASIPNYGTLDDASSVHMDEEEVRREREALDNITSHASEYASASAQSESISHRVLTM
jgi:hypothetical protein